MSIMPFVQGFVTAAGLVAAIGAQNAYVLRQAVSGSHLFMCAISCALIDSTLILLGIGRWGEFINSNVWLCNVARFGGIIFLLVYAAKSLRSCFNTEVLDLSNLDNQMSAKKVFLGILGFSLLNPHVYLDTVVLLGSIGAQFPGKERSMFAIGAISLSFVWFFGLCYGAKFLAPLFKRKTAWRVLDGATAAMMLFVVYSLIKMH